jgi:hypothetical protein
MADTPTEPTLTPQALTAEERELIRTALLLLLSTLGREEADEIEEVQALLVKLGPRTGA